MGEKYSDQGLKIMLFPSHEFGEQEFEDNAEILEFAVRARGRGKGGGAQFGAVRTARGRTTNFTRECEPLLLRIVVGSAATQESKGFRNGVYGHLFALGACKRRPRGALASRRLSFPVSPTALCGEGSGCAAGGAFFPLTPRSQACNRRVCPPLLPPSGNITGKTTRPLWQYLYAATETSAPTWNFKGKYLIDRSGKAHEVKNLEAQIQTMLAEKIASTL